MAIIGLMKASEEKLRVRALEDALREFINDVEAVGAKQVGHEWPDLSVTYNKAKRLIEGEAQSYEDPVAKALWEIAQRCRGDTFDEEEVAP